MRLAYLFPGQGAQYVGMGKELYDAFPTVRSSFQQASDYLKQDMAKLLFSSSQEELSRTKYSQIALYLTGVCAVRVLKEEFDIAPAVCAGMSVGEYGALVAANMLSFEQGLCLVRQRAELMERACLKREGGMAAIIGLTYEEVKLCLEEIEPPCDVWIANVNSPKQVVISGRADDLTTVIEELKKKGARKSIALNVEGAFHSGLMSEAQNAFAAFVSAAPFELSDIALIMNISASCPESIEELRQGLIDQISGSVLWYQTIVKMQEMQVTAFLELGCGSTLRNLNRRMGCKENNYRIENVRDLEEISSEYLSHAI